MSFLSGAFDRLKESSSTLVDSTSNGFATLKSNVATTAQKTAYTCKTLVTTGQMPPATNILEEFADKHKGTFRKITATQFLRIWQFYDEDKNGYIEGEELDKFIAQLFNVVNPDVKLDGAELVKWKAEFMTKYDENKDGKLEINELVHLLPMEDNFLVIFRNDNPLAKSIDFMKMWKEFDADNSGFIEAGELENFLTAYLKKIKAEVTPDKVKEYSSIILQLFDANGDGKLGISEMTKLLPVKSNFIADTKIAVSKKIEKKDIDAVFNNYDALLPVKDHFLTEAHISVKNPVTKEQIDATFKNYDVDASGEIEGLELEGFLKDLFAMTHQDYDVGDLASFKKTVMDCCDKNKDGNIDRDELTVLMMQLNQLIKK